MGIFSALDSHQAAPPNTPPNQHGPVLPSLSTVTVNLTWKPPAPPSPPMSHYDRSPAADMSSRSDVDDRRDTSTAAPRQQLPSLSSLFGPPSQIRPLNSPLSDRPSPYSAPSPLDRPQSGAAPSERSLSGSSYFPPSVHPPSVSQPRSTYDVRYVQESAYPRQFTGAVSPKTRELEHSRPEASPDVVSSSKWSLHQEAGRHEYSLGSREHQSYPPLDRMPHHVSSQRSDRDPTIGYRELARQHLPPTPNPPPTSVSTATSEGIPVKDGLGPKIWTGTHFLPRFVRAAEVPGEGMCYFYDDGSHCKTVIDGEAVNAHWGVTKAGKPRKRLAIACVTCREKKIKCDPDYPRCVQCEKFGRVCKFKNAPRGGHNNSPGTPPGELDDNRRMTVGGPVGGIPSTKPNEAQRRPRSQSSASLSPRSTLRPASPEPTVSSKRPRIGYDAYAPPMGDRQAMAQTPESTKSALWWQQTELPRVHEDVLMRAWQKDPYVNDPPSVSSVIASFFARIECTTLRFLPEKPFTSWVQSNAHRKSPEDLMLVYSILAVGLALSPRCTQGLGGASDKALAYDYAQVARFAADRAQMSLQLVQARLLLAVYYLTISRPRESNDMSSAAISAATCIQLNLELDVSTDASLEAFPYGLNRAGYEETRRRTFWSCFLLERLNGLFPSRMSMINVDDIFIRLPVPARSFEALADLPTPQFDQAQSNIEENGADIMGSLVTLVAIWAEVMTTAYRVSHRTSASEFDFVEYFARMDQKLTRWHRSLKSPHVFSAENLEQTIRENELGTFVTMHLLYHLTMLKLNRHVHSRFLAFADPHGAARKFWHVAAAKDHASKILDAVAMIRDLAARRPDYPISPLASYAVVEALDVLSAEGLVDDIGSLVDRLAAGRDVQMSLSSIWEGVGAQANAMRDRISLLRRIQDQAASQSQSAIPGSYTFVNREEPITKGQLPTGVCWRLTEPLETRFPKLMDVIYNQRAPSPHITPSAAD